MGEFTLVRMGQLVVSMLLVWLILQSSMKKKGLVIRHQETYARLLEDMFGVDVLQKTSVSGLIAANAAAVEYLGEHGDDTKTRRGLSGNNAQPRRLICSPESDRC